MTKNKCTLIIDGNWLLNSRMHVMADKFDKRNDISLRKDAQTDLTDFLARSIVVALNKLPVVDNIILVADGGSWRKKLHQPELAKDVIYKGNRSLSKDLDWDCIFQSLNDLCSKCEELGITTCRFLDIEGDDWCWYWSRRLNEDGINCIIWSIDNDLKQLIQTHNGAFTAWYCSDKTGLFLPDSLKEPDYDDIEFFLQPTVTSPTLEALQRQAGHTTYIDPNTIILNKIICGDTGDNIKSIIRYKKNGKVRRISERDWKKLSESCDIQTVDDIKDLSRKETVLINEIVKQYSGVRRDIDYQSVKEMLDYNKKLVWLNENIIPETTISKMNDKEYKIYDISYIKNNYKVLTKQSTDIESLFDGISF